MNQRVDVGQLVDSVGVVKASGARMVAGVLFTYRCSIACKHCCFGCEQTRPDVVMTPAQCVQALRLLHETGRVVRAAWPGAPGRTGIWICPPGARLPELRALLPDAPVPAPPQTFSLRTGRNLLTPGAAISWRKWRVRQCDWGSTPPRPRARGG